MSDFRTPTPHISAKKGDFAPVVLMPGDPRRAQFVAENFLDSPRLVNDVRGIKGYTGTYHGCPVSVMASGMGMPSMGIYSYELFAGYDVERIIRIGSAGAMQEGIQIRDIVLGMGACTNSAFASQYNLPGTYAPIADFDLLRRAADACEKLGARYHVGNLLSSDTFYNDDADGSLAWCKMGVMAVEMEAAALYCNAARLGKSALAICTVSDHLLTGEATTSAERETTFTKMMEVALEASV